MILLVVNLVLCIIDAIHCPTADCLVRIPRMSVKNCRHAVRLARRLDRQQSNVASTPASERDVAASPARRVMFSGIQPTGIPHVRSSSI